jgi:hypothetical protein
VTDENPKCRNTGIDPDAGLKKSSLSPLTTFPLLLRDCFLFPIAAGSACSAVVDMPAE